jgi:GNAT superfamily N-acetyltransferase
MDINLIHVRKALSGDAGLLAELGASAFSQAFGDQNTPENMTLYLSGAFSESIQSAELARPGSTYFIIEYSGVPAGFARLQAESTDTCISGSRPIELVRFYVLQKWVGKGIAGILMEACLNEARSDGHDAIWLGVWKENPRAIAFYRKWGFREVGTHTFTLGTDVQQDCVMAQTL